MRIECQHPSGACEQVRVAMRHTKDKEVTAKTGKTDPRILHYQA
jgi:hypothetical protein